MRVGITGAAGTVGRVLTEGLGKPYQLSLFDKVPADGSNADRFVQIDLTQPNEISGKFDGLDAVVHLAAVHRSNPGFPEVVAGNVMATFNLLEEARRAGVKRVVFASTNHVQNARAVGDLKDMMSMSKEFVASGELVSAQDAPAPDSYYGVSKLCCEDLGRYYAEFLRCIEFVALRIGWVAPADPSQAPIEKVLRNSATHRHFRALFLSRRDAVHLFDRALQADLRFFVGFGTSRNPVPIFDLTETIKRLDYRPQDNSFDYFQGTAAGPLASELYPSRRSGEWSPA